MSKIEIRTAYGVYINPGLDFGDEASLCQQNFQDECDFNKVLEKWRVSGQPIDHLNTARPGFLDVSDVQDYQTALQTIEDAQELFLGLPARVRERFNNDPAELLGYLSDAKPSPEKIAEAVGLGLISGGEPERAQNAGVGSPPEAPPGASNPPQNEPKA